MISLMWNLINKLNLRNWNRLIENRLTTVRGLGVKGGQWLQGLGEKGEPKKQNTIDTDNSEVIISGKGGVKGGRRGYRGNK